MGREQSTAGQTWVHLRPPRWAGPISGRRTTFLSRTSLETICCTCRAVNMMSVGLSTSSRASAGALQTINQNASAAPGNVKVVTLYKPSKGGNRNKPPKSLFATELKLAVTQRQAAKQAAEIQDLRLQLAAQQAECKKQQTRHQLQLRLQEAQTGLQIQQQRMAQQQAAEIKQLRERLQQQATELSQVQQQAQHQCQALQQKLRQTKAVALKLLRQWQDEVMQNQALEQQLDNNTQQQQYASTEPLQLMVDFTKSQQKACLADQVRELQKADCKTPPAAAATQPLLVPTSKLQATPPQPAVKCRVPSTASGKLLQSFDSMDCPGTPSRVDNSSRGSTRRSRSTTDSGSNVKGPGTPSATGSRSACTRSSYSSSDPDTSCSSQAKNPNEPGASSWWWWSSQDATSTLSSSNNGDNYGSIFSSWWQGGAATGVATG